MIFNLNLFNGTDNEENPRKLKLKNIPLQKWNNVILILKDRTVEMYLDGRLEETYLVNWAFIYFYAQYFILFSLYKIELVLLLLLVQ